MDENPLEIKQQRINYWLRHHSDYQVAIYLNSMYATLCVRITKEHFDPEQQKIVEEHVKSYIGTRLERRFDQAIAYLKIDEWEGPWKWWLSREENEARGKDGEEKSDETYTT